jgi:hypothetical protein
MRFEIKKRPHPNIARFHGQDYALALAFSQKIVKELGDFLKAVVLFGSASRAVHPGGSNDIDVLLIINDLTVMVTPEVVSAYRVIVENTAQAVSPKLHINTMKMTAVWDYARVGDPLLINILREGVPLHDIGFFEPLQMLLSQGRIRPSKEAVWTYYARTPMTMHNSRMHVMQACIDLYWACVDAAHAALMHVGEMPHLPEDLPMMIDQKLVKPGLAPRSAPAIMKFFYDLQKDITNRKRQGATGQEYDNWAQDAKSFIDMMRGVIERKG